MDAESPNEEGPGSILPKGNPTCLCYPLICIYYRKVRLVGKILFTNIDEGTTNPGVECIYQRVKMFVEKNIQVFGVISHPNFNELQGLNLTS